MNVRFYLLQDICHFVHKVIMDILMFPENLYTTSGLLILLDGVISLKNAMSFFFY